MTKEHTVAIGNRAEANVLAALLEIYDTVLLPYGGNCRYDLVVDTPEGLKRVQCKSGRLRDGAIEFATCSSTRHWKNGSFKTYYGEADYFGVYCPELKAVYLVPVDACGKYKASLRVDPSRNNQSKGTRLAADYLIGASSPN